MPSTGCCRRKRLRLAAGPERGNAGESEPAAQCGAAQALGEDLGGKGGSSPAAGKS